MKKLRKLWVLITAFLAAKQYPCSYEHEIDFSLPRLNSAGMPIDSRGRFLPRSTYPPSFDLD
jgi:hypothetical protein